MDEQRQSGWQKTRAMGQWRFTLAVGLVAWPLTMFVISRIVRYLRDRPLWDDLAADVLTWIAGGIMAATVMWVAGEWRYRNR